MKKFTIFAIMFCIAGIVAAQSAVVSVGGDAQSNGGSVSYTVGQVAVQTVANSNGSVSVAEGVQQPYEIMTVGVDDYPHSTVSRFPPMVSALIFTTATASVCRPFPSRTT